MMGKRKSQRKPSNFYASISSNQLLCSGIITNLSKGGMYIKTQEKLAPKTHNLILLADKSLLNLDDNQYKHLAILMRYQPEGRYPDEEILMSSNKEALSLFNETKELLEWLMKEL